MHYVYRAYDHVGTLLYVGVTGDVRNRFGLHAQRSEWLPYAVDLTADRYAERAAAEAAERAAIRAEAPVFNVRGRSAAERARLVEAYPRSVIDLDEVARLELHRRTQEMLQRAFDVAPPGPGPDGERWRPVRGYEGLYEASDHGRVRSLDRWIGGRSGKRRWAGRILRPQRRGPYDNVDLCADGTITRRGVHVVVLEAFVGARPAEYLACHRNGDHVDNRLANLYWGTLSDNARDRVEHGRHWLAERETDKYGHRLEAPNLADRPAKVGRVCLACARAQAGQNYARRCGRPFDFEAETNRHYAEIMAGTDRGGMAGRETCPRDHPLKAPNLVASIAREGRRSCLACGRTHSRWAKAKRAGRPFDFVAVADAIYEEITGESFRR